MKKQSIIKSFQNALIGIIICFSQERNMWLHSLAVVIVIVCGLYWHIQKQEWFILFLTMGGVICFEIVNTAIEKTVDLVTSDYHELAKRAKDIAAGAVLLFSCIAVIIGCMIFIPYIFN